MSSPLAGALRERLGRAGAKKAEQRCPRVRRQARRQLLRRIGGMADRLLRKQLSLSGKLQALAAAVRFMRLLQNDAVGQAAEGAREAARPEAPEDPHDIGKRHRPRLLVGEARAAEALQPPPGREMDREQKPELGRAQPGRGQPAGEAPLGGRPPGFPSGRQSRRNHPGSCQGRLPARRYRHERTTASGRRHQGRGADRRGKGRGRRVNSSSHRISIELMHCCAFAPLALSAIAPHARFAIAPFRHRAVQPPRLRAFPPFRLLAFPPFRRFAIAHFSPFRHRAVQPPRLRAFPPSRLSAIAPFNRLAFAPFRQFAASPIRHCAVSPFRHSAIAPFNRPPTVADGMNGGGPGRPNRVFRWRRKPLDIGFGDRMERSCKSPAAAIARNGWRDPAPAPLGEGFVSISSFLCGENLCASARKPADRRKSPYKSTQKPARRRKSLRIAAKARTNRRKSLRVVAKACASPQKAVQIDAKACASSQKPAHRRKRPYKSTQKPYKSTQKP